MAPTLGPITRRNGVAGQVSYSVPVTYPDEPTETITFVGSVYTGSMMAGPVVMVTAESQTFVHDPTRYGTFGPEWVRKFFA